MVQRQLFLYITGSFCVQGVDSRSLLDSSAQLTEHVSGLLPITY